MKYRGWLVTAHRTFSGCFAQYTSPTGHTHQTYAGFATEQEALSYAQSVIDLLVKLQQARFAAAPALAAAG